MLPYHGAPPFIVHKTCEARDGKEPEEKEPEDQGENAASKDAQQK